MNTTHVCGLAAAFFLLGMAPVAAQEDEELPTINTLSCAGACTRATPPKPADDHMAHFPGFLPIHYPTEGVVVLRATVTKEGTLKDQQVVGLVGAKVFAEKTLESSKEWHYQPATRDGVPVERPNWLIVTKFSYKAKVTGVRESVSGILRKGIALTDQRKYADSITELLPVMSMEHLNFFERSVAALQLGIDYLQQGDVATAREYLDEVALIGDKYLPPALRQMLWRVSVINDIKGGYYFEAQQAFAKLRAVKPVTEDEPVAKLLSIADENIHTGNMVTITGRVATVNPLPQWHYSLLRRNISILNVSGKLDRIVISCGENVIESTFSDKAEWHIPKSWEGCNLNVQGSAGTTFTLAQSAT